MNQIHRRTDATPSELSVIQSLTRRSPIASANAGLNDATPLELVLAHGHHLLDEFKNSIARETPASFGPGIDQNHIPN